MNEQKNKRTVIILSVLIAVVICAASVVAAILCGKCEFDSPVAVHLRGGTLIITVKSDFRVYMRGSAVKVYEGVYEYEYQDK